jgi:hypothetical protein
MTETIDLVCEATIFAYRVIWSDEDGEYVGLCAEFPSLTWLDSHQEGALAGIMKLVRETVAEMTSNGETAPIPTAGSSRCACHNGWKTAWLADACPGVQLEVM